MSNKLVFDDSYTFHTKIYCDVFNFMKNVLIRARTGTCATTGTFTLLVYSSALQFKKVQSFIEKFHWSKKLRKTENFSFNLNVRVPLESVNLFLHVFFCLKVILAIKHYIKVLTIFI